MSFVRLVPLRPLFAALLVLAGDEPSRQERAKMAA